MSYGTAYIDIPQLKPQKAVGKGHKMPNNTKTAEPSKPAKKYAKTRGEHYKDILIAVLVTAVIAFIGGMHFSNQQHAETERAVKAATLSANAEPKK